MSQPVFLDESERAAAPRHTIEVHGVSEALLQRLDERARESGIDRSQVIQAILSKELGNQETETATSSFDAVLAPIRQGFAEGGLSEDEATGLLEEGLRAVRQLKRSGNSHSNAREASTQQRAVETGQNGH